MRGPFNLEQKIVRNRERDFESDSKPVIDEPRTLHSLLGSEGETLTA